MLRSRGRLAPVVLAVVAFLLAVALLKSPHAAAEAKPAGSHGDTVTADDRHTQPPRQMACPTKWVGQSPLTRMAVPGWEHTAGASTQDGGEW